MMGHWAMSEDMDWLLYTSLSVLVVVSFVLLMQWILPRIAGGKNSKAEAELGKEEDKEEIGDIDLRLMDYYLATIQ